MEDPQLDTSVHCRRCGSGTQPDPEGSEHPWCPSCRRLDYRNPAPAVGVAIVRNARVLLSQRARAPKAHWWDLVGGFVEPGESADDAVRREAEEETGLGLKDVVLDTVQPGDYDGEPTLNLLYTATADGEPRAADDSAQLRWWPLDALPDRLAWPHEEQFLRRLASQQRS